ncbi:MAG: hypothetical protein VZR32_01005 [Candidatus Weimeria sp.]|nr:hypothetical protein [Candidatus Weimeria sp.]
MLFGIIFLFYLLLSALVTFHLRLWKNTLTNPPWLVIWLVPFVGAAIGEMQLRFDRDKRREELPIGLEKLVVDQVRYEKIRMSDNRNQDITVPLEEAMVVNDEKVRRKLIVDVLNHDPRHHIDLLKKASMTDDTELSHFATTAMMNIQSDYEAKIAKIEEALEEEPKDPVLLRAYRRELTEYVGSGLVSGIIRRIYCRKLSEVLRQLVYMYPDRRHYRLQWIRIRIETEELDEVEQDLIYALREWPDYVPFYRLYVAYAQRRKDGKLLQEVLEQVEKNGAFLSQRDRSWYRFWKGRSLT